MKEMSLTWSEVDKVQQTWRPLGGALGTSGYKEVGNHSINTIAIESFRIMIIVCLVLSNLSLPYQHCCGHKNVDGVRLFINQCPGSSSLISQ